MVDVLRAHPTEIRSVAAQLAAQAVEIAARPIPMGLGDAGDQRVTIALRAVLEDIQGVRGAVVTMMTSRANDLQKAADAYEQCETQLRSGLDSICQSIGTTAS